LLVATATLALVAPAGAAAGAREAKIKIIVERDRNSVVGLVYSHNVRCVGARRARVFEVAGSRRRLLDTDTSVRRGSIGVFRLALGRMSRAGCTMRRSRIRRLRGR
jgi:hypothetical protein